MKSFSFPGYQYWLYFGIVFLFIFLIRTKGKNFTIYLLFFLQFFKGPLEYSGILTSNRINLISEFILFILVLIFILKRKFYLFKHLKYFILLLFVLLFSMYLNNTSFVELLLYVYKIMFIPIALIIFIYYDELRVEEFNKFLHLILIIQPIIMLHKLLFYGAAEEFVGSLSIGEGSQTTMLALIVISQSLIRYIITMRKTYLYYILAYIFFVIMGGKRAPFLYIPLIFLIVVFLVNKYLSIRSSKVFAILLSSIIIIFSIYAILRYNESLNPTRGSIDSQFAINYTSDYLLDEGSSGIEGYGRLAAFPAVFSKINKKGIYGVVFGKGPGIWIPSFLKRSQYGTDKEIMMNLYGLGYGARIGFLYSLFQTGLLGVFLYLLLVFKIIRTPLTHYTFFSKKGNVNLTRYYSLVAVFLIDFFSYSQVMMKVNAVSLLFCYLIGYLVRKNSNKLTNENEGRYETIIY